MLGDALNYPIKDDTSLKTILIGGLLGIFSVLIVPIFLLQGYFLRVLDGASEGTSVAPVFDDWGELFVDGLKMFVVTLVYVFVPTVVFFGLGVVIAGGALLTGDPGVLAGAGVFGLLLFFLYVVVVFLATYLLPIGLTNLAREGDIGAAFDTTVLSSVATNADYIVAVILTIVIAVVLGTIAALLTVVLIGFFVQFYVQVVALYLLGRGVGEAMGARGGGATAAGVTSD